jgi:dTDP-4-dehydrorhamnose reductase
MPLKIFLTGGSGTLGKELQKISKDYDILFTAPESKYCNITNSYQIRNNIAISNCDTVLHCAALTNVKEIENDPEESWLVNVYGTINVLRACAELNKKLIFISTDYVFDGEKGNYNINDPINPLSNYAKSKASAELLVRTYEKSLTIRTSFYGHQFPYEKAAEDQWPSKDYVDIIAPKILKEIKKENYGIAHVGSERRTIYDIAKDRNQNITKAKRNDFGINIPRDTSFGK